MIKRELRKLGGEVGGTVKISVFGNPYNRYDTFGI
jgi:hypothetical protein